MAISAERILNDKEVPVSVIPTPKSVDSECGFVLRIGGDLLQDALHVLKNNDVVIDLVFSRELINDEYIYERVDSISDTPRLPSLLDNCTSGGCGAKISPGELSKALESITDKFAVSDSNLLVGFNSSDDAAVYRIDDKRSLISTVDFFPPMVADAKTFGRIAAANALSDIYAMGGTPLYALNMVCFPQSMDIAILSDILAGGASKCLEAGVPIAGGHSIYDKEIKYGLSVTGVADTDKIYRNNTPRVGDKLILTKPLGVGIVLAAERAGMASAGSVDEVIRSMERLNKSAAKCMSEYDVSACTDITGFGLLGHLLEMTANRVSVELYYDSIPYFESARMYAEEFLLTAAGQRNRNFVRDRIDISNLPFWLQELVFDPQTSGGLLIAVKSEQAEKLLGEILVNNPQAAIIGTIR